MDGYQAVVNWSCPFSWVKSYTCICDFMPEDWFQLVGRSHSLISGQFPWELRALEQWIRARSQQIPLSPSSSFPLRSFGDLLQLVLSFPLFCEYSSIRLGMPLIDRHVRTACQLLPPLRLTFLFDFSEVFFTSPFYST